MVSNPFRGLLVLLNETFAQWFPYNDHFPLTPIIGERVSKGLSEQNEHSPQSPELPEGFDHFPLTPIIGESVSKGLNEQNEHSPESPELPGESAE